MATILARKDSKKRILRSVQFTGIDGRRKTVGLGRVREKVAVSICHHVEELLRSKITGYAYADETARWIRDLDQPLFDKLVDVGLLKPRLDNDLDSMKLGDFIDFYIAKRTDVKPLTIVKYKAGRKAMVDYFGENKPIGEINEFDTEDWQRTLRDKGYAENTVRKHTATAKLMFGAARKKKLISVNPFESLSAAIRPNHERFFFITHEMSIKIIEACPDNEWRLIFVLSRYAGLRCPSEHLLLRWQDVKWEKNRILVSSPKTEHHEGHESRLIPIFGEMREYLNKAFDEAKPGEEFLITRYRMANSNLRTRMKRIIENAGLDVWPKLFQNLRSSRQTELEDTFPAHTVCKWIGNSDAVAAKHYRQVRETSFDQACAANALQNTAEMQRKHQKVVYSEVS